MSSLRRAAKWGWLVGGCGEKLAIWKGMGKTHESTNRHNKRISYSPWRANVQHFVQSVVSSVVKTEVYNVTAKKSLFQKEVSPVPTSHPPPFPRPDLPKYHLTVGVPMVILISHSGRAPCNHEKDIFLKIHSVLSSGSQWG